MPRCRDNGDIDGSYWLRSILAECATMNYKRNEPSEAIWFNAQAIADDRSMSTEQASEFWNDHHDEYVAFGQRRVLCSQISAYWQELSLAWRALADADHECLAPEIYLAADEDVSQTITLGNPNQGLGLRSALQVIAAVHRQDAVERSMEKSVTAIDLVLGLTDT